MPRILFTSRDGGDLKEVEARQNTAELLSLPDIRFMKQSHSDVVVEVRDQSGDLECDAMVTTRKGVGLAALAADCMPITFSSRTVIGVAHVGRVGLFKEIAPRTVEVMRSLGAEDISAIIGPSICGNCYEVSSEMYEECVALLPSVATSPTKHALNLQSGVIFQLTSLGVKIEDFNVCTLENSDYFSFRKGDLVARQAGIISL